jgi:uncharacterized protein (TIGR03546 family)
MAMIFIKLLGKLIQILESGSTPGRVAWAFALGTIPGWTPFWCLHNGVVFVLLFILNVPFSAGLFGFAMAGLLALALDPLFHSIGYAVLVQVPFLQPLWTSFYNAPLAPLMRLNNTVVMGSLLFSLVLLIPTVLFFKWFVVKYRADWRKHVERLKIMKVIKGTGLVQWGLKLKGMEG